MLFITACLKRNLDGLRLALVCAWLSFAGLAMAAEVEVSSPQLIAADEGYAVSADFQFELSSRLEEAVMRGVVLTFLIDFELVNKRWYWLDEKLLSRQMSLRLYYHALTRQYRVASGGGLHQSFPTLNEALRVVSRLRSWQVIEKASDFPQIKSGEGYRGALRFKLDVTLLPKPFQISAVGSRDWHLASDWKTWNVNLPAPESK
ncbi:MAG: putative proline rich signal peptide protein [Proteobacteria bacterium]|nr:putative proline rich signal peptide protein [Pseudomonadota bacterium]